MTPNEIVEPALPPDDLPVADDGWDDRTPELDEEGIAALIHADPPVTREHLVAAGLFDEGA